MLRLTIGPMLIVHGYNKVFGQGGLEGTTRWFDALGLHPAHVHARLAAATEIGAGTMLTLGAASPLPAAAAIGLMTTAARTDHKGKGFFIFRNGWEYVGVVGAVSAVIAALGPGRFSVDAPARPAPARPEVGPRGRRVRRDQRRRPAGHQLPPGPAARAGGGPRRTGRGSRRSIRVGARSRDKRTAPPWPTTPRGRPSPSRRAAGSSRSPTPARCSSPRPAAPSWTWPAITRRSSRPSWRPWAAGPVLLQRFPHGAGGPSFFQKRVPEKRPDWLETTIVSTPNGTTSQALVAADLAHVLWAVNLACLGFHVWPNRADDPDHADELRIDLDPTPGVDFEMVREAAHEVDGLLREVGLTGWPKTTGNRGIHVYVRLLPRWSSIEVRAAAVAVARELERRRPDLMTAAWWKEERGRRVFVDFNQNAPHKTVFGAWSVRARPGAQVSAPVRLVGAWRHPPGRPDDGHRGGPLPRAGRPLGAGDAGVARTAAGNVAARRRQRPARRPVAAGVPEDAGRAAPGGTQPGPQET